MRGPHADLADFAWDYLMRAFASRTALLSPSGEHIRVVPGELAAALVAAGTAEIHKRNGRIRSIRLTQPATSYGQVIGAPEGSCRGTRFVYREMLDQSGARVWAHHPRATDYE